MIKLTSIPIKQPDGKKPRQRKLLFRTCTALLAGFMFIYASGVLKPPKASALSAVLPPCSNTFLETWDWPADLRRGNHSGGFTDGAGLTNFDYENDSYVIFKRTSMDTSTPKRNIFEMYLTYKNDGRLVLKNTSGVPFISTGAGASSFKWKATILSEPRKMVLPGYYVWPNGYSDVDTSPGSDNTNDITLDVTQTSCVVAAHNVTYDNAWLSTWNKFVGAVDFKAGADAAISCTTLDIACKLKQAWNGVTDTFAAVGQAIVEGIASLFMPDGTQVKADFDDLTSFLNAKLGFLTYPVTFFVNMFNAFSSTANNWCTASSCTKNFGNLFGHAFNVDLKVGATAYPTYWTYFLTLTRGLVVLGLLLAVRKKYMGVIHK